MEEVYNGEVDTPKTINAYLFLRSIPWLPANDDGKYPTNSDIRRWLERSAVIINGAKPHWRDDITLPIHQLIFFPKGKRRTTYL